MSKFTISGKDKKIVWEKYQAGKNKPTKAQFDEFIAVCEARVLNPLLGEIHLVLRWNKNLFGEGKGGLQMAVQTGIDGFRKIAERTGTLAGMDEPEFNEDAKGNIIRCKVTTWKIVKGVRCPFVGVAYWTEFYPGDAQGMMWKKMKHVMIAKCAEVQSLRKGWPGDFAGLYVDEEMHQADVPTADETKIEVANKRFQEPEEPRVDQKVLDAFAKFEITQEDLERLTTKPAIDWVEKDKDILGEHWQQLKTGMTTKKDLIPKEPKSKKMTKKKTKSEKESSDEHEHGDFSGKSSEGSGDGGVQEGPLPD